VIVQDGDRWVEGRELCAVVEARRAEDVVPALREVEKATASGISAAGFISYEAARGLDECLTVHDPAGLPLAWFGLFGQLAPVEKIPEAGLAFQIGNWQNDVSYDEYAATVARIKALIAAGDTYQVNYTMRLRTMFAGRPQALFARLARSQRARYSAFIDCGDWAICSASPELFFTLDGRQLISRPMKGTAPRGLRPADDNANRDALAASEKDRAENAMIVDMVRNDMSRIAELGSVQVSEAFAIEEYPTLFQMTSTVQCRTGASFSEIIRAMFPGASITGAPKVRTMQIIRQLEPQPRGVYTGAIGYLAPNRRAQFNIAIRTVAIHKPTALAEYGVGSGIVWDSDAAAEYAECRTKSAVLEAARK
jgi:para-aminobenzoate synthetase/4-amino-4-deoxychorismate lyase